MVKKRTRFDWFFYALTWSVIMGYFILTLVAGHYNPQYEDHVQFFTIFSKILYWVHLILICSRNFMLVRREFLNITIYKSSV